MLGRSYTVVGQHADALKAYERAVALRPTDAQVLADYADSMAVNNNMSLAGEPMKWVAKALQADPNNLKALALVSRTMRDPAVVAKLRANSDPAKLYAILTEARAPQAA